MSETSDLWREYAENRTLGRETCVDEQLAALSAVDRLLSIAERNEHLSDKASAEALRVTLAVTSRLAPPPVESIAPPTNEVADSAKNSVAVRTIRDLHKLIGGYLPCFTGDKAQDYIILNQLRITLGHFVNHEAQTVLKLLDVMLQQMDEELRVPPRSQS